MIEISSALPRYEDHDPKIPIWCVTPNRPGCFHRFFDTPAISPSGRYLACLQMPFEDRVPAPGETAAVILVDLHTGQDKVVAETAGWEPQMGANINWGPDDHTLLLADVDTDSWTPLLVKLDPLTGVADKIEGGIYHASPDGKLVSVSNPIAMRRTQTGYGITVPDEHVPHNVGAREDDGLFIIDVETGRKKLVFSLADAVKLIGELDGADLDQWEIYGFHSKFSPDGQKLIFTVRRYRREEGADWDNIGRSRFDVFTLRPDGSDAHNAVPSIAWAHGGHHINWYPDSEHLSMNLAGYGRELRFWRVRRDGWGLRPILWDTPGSGHPTVHPDGRHILSDTYAWEATSYGDGTTPLRWVDLSTGEVENVARFGSVVEPKNHASLRVDPHPAWDRSWRYVTFNAVTDNTRRVFLADFGPLLER
jgi:Tol biopolymer transport system component